MRDPCELRAEGLGELAALPGCGGHSAWTSSAPLERQQPLQVIWICGPCPQAWHRDETRLHPCASSQADTETAIQVPVVPVGGSPREYE